MVDEVRLLGYLKPSSFRALKMERANMKLNLWMIANRLYQMEPKLYIPEDAPINLQSARLSVVPNCVFVYQKGKDVGQILWKDRSKGRNVLSADAAALTVNHTD